MTDRKEEPAITVTVVDWRCPEANMYGCSPCPRCASPYRCMFNRKDERRLVECDDCGKIEIAFEVQD